MAQNIDWGSLGFGYVPTPYNVRCTYTNKAWGELRVCDTPEITLHISSAVLHYAQECFEGMKAFRGKDGKVRIFRIEDGGRRMQDSCRGIQMPELPLEKFVEAVKKVVELNADFIPPYGTGASLYIRPVLFATTPLVGVKPADDYEFVVFVTPVGPYFKGGFKSTPFMLSRKYDRAAPLGTGNIKVGGNYAASMRPHVEACHGGKYACEFYLDAKEKCYIDEAGAANFFAIKDNTYITPLSTSILPSITNKSLMFLAEKMGMKVERRPIHVDELATFEEAGACGTAAVISPISRIDDLDNNKSYVFGDGKPGPQSEKLYNKLRGIQCGTEPDEYGWITFVEGC